MKNIDELNAAIQEMCNDQPKARNALLVLASYLETGNPEQNIAQSPADALKCYIRAAIMGSTDGYLGTSRLCHKICLSAEDDQIKIKTEHADLGLSICPPHVITQHAHPEIAVFIGETCEHTARCCAEHGLSERARAYYEHAAAYYNLALKIVDPIEPTSVSTMYQAKFAGLFDIPLTSEDRGLGRDASASIIRIFDPFGRHIDCLALYSWMITPNKPRAFFLHKVEKAVAYPPKLVFFSDFQKLATLAAASRLETEAVRILLYETYKTYNSTFEDVRHLFPNDGKAVLPERPPATAQAKAMSEWVCLL